MNISTRSFSALIPGSGRLKHGRGVPANISQPTIFPAAVEVKAANIKKPKISRSLRSFIQAYSPDQVLVVNQGLRHSTREDGVDVRYVVPPEFPQV